ncbi:MAG: hypothetical protein HQ582_13180 [Planctomycetes bacterium]|nr:hypothetical protein [Planctomycetota bacterium]
MSDQESGKRPPGTCIPWEEKRKQLAEITGDEDLVKRVWEDTDCLAYIYIWHCLLAF